MGVKPKNIVTVQMILSVNIKELRGQKSFFHKAIESRWENVLNVFLRWNR